MLIAIKTVSALLQPLFVIQIALPVKFVLLTTIVHKLHYINSAPHKINVFNVMTIINAKKQNFLDVSKKYIYFAGLLNTCTSCNADNHCSHLTTTPACYISFGIS